MRCFLLLLIASLLLFRCSPEKDFEPVYNVPEEFQPFVDAFISEASSRGIHLEMNNLIITFDDNLGVLCGSCNVTGKKDNVQRIIKVNPNGSCWNISQGKESLIFHELGHCVLNRPHINELLPNGDPKSIMISENRKFYWPCIYNIVGESDSNCDNTFKRQYYIDELFDEDTVIPDWAI